MITVKLSVPSDFSQDLFEKLCDGFKSKFRDNDVCFERRTDDTLIGGFVAEYNGKVYDLSVSGRLKVLSEYLKMPSEQEAAQ